MGNDTDGPRLHVRAVWTDKEKRKTPKCPDYPELQGCYVPVREKDGGALATDKGEKGREQAYAGPIDPRLGYSALHPGPCRIITTPGEGKGYMFIVSDGSLTAKASKEQPGLLRSSVVTTDKARPWSEKNWMGWDEGQGAWTAVPKLPVTKMDAWFRVVVTSTACPAAQGVYELVDVIGDMPCWANLKYRIWSRTEGVAGARWVLTEAGPDGREIDLACSESNGRRNVYHMRFWELLAGDQRTPLGSSDFSVKPVETSNSLGAALVATSHLLHEMKVSLQHRMHTHAPKALKIVAPSASGYTGVYGLVNGASHNSCPVWGCQAMRVYAGREGHWQITGHYRNLATEVAGVRTIVQSTGRYPHEVAGGWGVPDRERPGWVKCEEIAVLRHDDVGKSSKSKNGKSMAESPEEVALMRDEVVSLRGKVEALSAALQNSYDEKAAEDAAHQQTIAELEEQHTAAREQWTRETNQQEQAIQQLRAEREEQTRAVQQLLHEKEQLAKSIRALEQRVNSAAADAALGDAPPTPDLSLGEGRPISKGKSSKLISGIMKAKMQLRRSSMLSPGAPPLPLPSTFHSSRPQGPGFVVVAEFQRRRWGEKDGGDSGETGSPTRSPTGSPTRSPPPLAQRRQQQQQHNTFAPWAAAGGGVSSTASSPTSPPSPVDATKSPFVAEAGGSPTADNTEEWSASHLATDANDPPRFAGRAVVCGSTPGGASLSSRHTTILSVFAARTADAPLLPPLETDIAPPDNCVWDDDWAVDFNATDGSTDGWTYTATCPTRAGGSTNCTWDVAEATSSQYRRRWWVRRYVHAPDAADNKVVKRMLLDDDAFMEATMAGVGKPAADDASTDDGGSALAPRRSSRSRTPPSERKNNRHLHFVPQAGGQGWLVNVDSEGESSDDGSGPPGGGGSSNNNNNGHSLGRRASKKAPSSANLLTPNDDSMKRRGSTQREADAKGKKRASMTLTKNVSKLLGKVIRRKSVQTVTPPTDPLDRDRGGENEGERDSVPSSPPHTPPRSPSNHSRHHSLDVPPLPVALATHNATHTSPAEGGETPDRGRGGDRSSDLPPKHGILTKLLSRKRSKDQRRASDLGTPDSSRGGREASGGGKHAGAGGAGSASSPGQLTPAMTLHSRGFSGVVRVTSEGEISQDSHDVRSADRGGSRGDSHHPIQIVVTPTGSPVALPIPSHDPDADESQHTSPAQTPAAATSLVARARNSPPPRRRRQSSRGSLLDGESPPLVGPRDESGLAGSSTQSGADAGGGGGASGALSLSAFQADDDDLTYSVSLVNQDGATPRGEGDHDHNGLGLARNVGDHEIRPSGGGGGGGDTRTDNTSPAASPNHAAADARAASARLALPPNRNALGVLSRTWTVGGESPPAAQLVSPNSSSYSRISMYTATVLRSCEVNNVVVGAVLAVVGVAAYADEPDRNTGGSPLLLPPRSSSHSPGGGFLSLHQRPSSPRLRSMRGGSPSAAVPGTSSSLGLLPTMLPPRAPSPAAAGRVQSASPAMAITPRAGLLDDPSPSPGVDASPNRRATFPTGNTPSPGSTISRKTSSPASRLKPVRDIHTDEEDVLCLFVVSPVAGGSAEPTPERLVTAFRKTLATSLEVLASQVRNARVAIADGGDAATIECRVAHGGVPALAALPLTLNTMLRGLAGSWCVDAVSACLESHVRDRRCPKGGDVVPLPPPSSSSARCAGDGAGDVCGCTNEHSTNDNKNNPADDIAEEGPPASDLWSRGAYGCADCCGYMLCGGCVYGALAAELEAGTFTLRRAPSPGDA